RAVRGTGCPGKSSETFSYYVGMVLLMLLMVYIMFKDIVNLF
ncbi:MAG: RIP metalloprotease RseP, partial [Lachnospira sp.]|nr:RIP metalloprotease RseP [Lachnospira sp.]